MPRPEKLKRKLLTPEKLKRKLLTPSRTWTEMDKDNTICPYHHSYRIAGSFFFVFFLFGFYGPFKNISLISSRSFIEGGRKPENPGEKPPDHS